MAKGFVNLNRFKHSRAVKRNSKLKADLHVRRNVRKEKQDSVARVD